MISSTPLGSLGSTGDVHEAIARASLSAFEARLLRARAALAAGNRNEAARFINDASFTLGKASAHVLSTTPGPLQSSMMGQVRDGATRLKQLLAVSLAGRLS